jgi:glycosyltransferase involved in cell wall biosynthesis/acetyltransferase-like isoleucine patch superfamily enzyme
MKNNEIVVFYSMLFREFNGTFYCNGAFGRYIDELANRYDKVYLCVPVERLEDDCYNDYSLQSKNVIIQSLPPYNGYLGALKNARSIKQKIKIESASWNSPVILRWPSPFFMLVSAICTKRCLPLMLHLVADTTKVIKNGSKYNSLSRFAAVLFSRFLDFNVSKLLIKTPALFNGRDLRRLYDHKDNKNLEIRTSTFFQSEVNTVVKNFNKDNIKVLYVGYLRHEKGLQYLLKAISLLLESKIKVHLTLVGDGPLKKDLCTLADSLKISANVTFLGHIPMGGQLFDEYRKHNIFVLPSISEGTPRVLVESMANGLVTVSTDAGGSAFTIDHGVNGLLCPPKNSYEICSTITRVAGDVELQTRLIKNGYKFAINNSIEHHVDQVVAHINKFCLLGDRNFVGEGVPWKILRLLFKTTPMHLTQKILSLLPNSVITQKLRGLMLKPYFGASGQNLRIADGVTFIHPENMLIGDDVYIANDCWINSTSRIYLEDQVILSPYVVVATTKHRRKKGRFLNSEPDIGEIRIGKGAWICSHSVITKGVQIGDGVLVGANSVVGRKVDENIFVSGIPAKIIRNLKTDEN